MLDLTQALTEPISTMRLADRGADQVKAEPPSGDVTRNLSRTCPRMMSVSAAAASGASTGSEVDLVLS